MSLQAKIESIDAEIARTQKNKATEHHLAGLKAKRALLSRELLEQSSKKAGPSGPSFEVAKSGTARVGLIGFPSVGKSTLLNSLTEAASEVADFEFTTLKPIPGMYTHQGARIQVIDLPGIIEGAKDGKGRGRQVIAAARTSDLLLICLDVTKPLPMKKKIEAELEGFGIRLNKRPRDIVFSRRDAGGISFHTTCKELPRLSEAEVLAALKTLRIISCELIVRDAETTIEDVIDVVSGRQVVYMPALYVMNKIDAITIEELELLDMLPNWVPVSAHHRWNLDELKAAIWEKLGLLRVYTKPRGKPIDYDEPVILKTRRHAPSVEAFCRHIHRDMAEQLKYALVWGTSVKFPGQRCGRAHVLHDEDVVTLITK
eukprot:gnl/Chilomastix_cuspidata/1435.p3 GENE.gnl/Chilomastix_cuspidata/1435~~gnl/Chilomastix_cuspidata/1435.p3  ORF type:complete len:380 (-),score=217.65 gnl/Chilomastix_cuspidata/1435:1707-2822(-)